MYVAQQWRLVRQLYDRHLLPVLGPLVSEGASDGASTRRALHVRHAMGTLAAGLVRFTLDAPGFMHHGTASVNEDGRLTAITIRKDQDYIHAAKKLINPTDINSRILQIGTYMISLSMRQFSGIVTKTSMICERPTRREVASIAWTCLPFGGYCL